ncbi:hypothetical protein N482_21020 [Pseudoalteromonas luteoviolacea NCIMB 1942]|uniref:N-acetyltransferase domain-containing protein n=2 Tax=Pseudoalteromonas luteoviolacea TaxID=43657 RepID=A0A166XMW5_9GAMM|nr:hypothetical protein N482_21020 [Pseudoalteromonas luteoviolacea NCIMB 1942]
MLHTISKIDSEKQIAYLESTNARNISFYESFGFKVLGEVSAGDSPAIYPMLRQAKS